MTKPVVPSYFDFVKDWLADRPKRTARKRTVGGLEPPRFVSPELAVFTRRRIRSGCLDWQPPRWFARHKRSDAAHRVYPAYHAKGIQGLIGKDHRLILAHTHGDRLRLRATLKFLEARTDDAFLSPRCYGCRPHGRRKCTDRGAALRRFRRLVSEDGHRWVAKLDVKKFFDRLPHGPVLAALATAVPDKGCCHEIEGYMAWYWRESWPGHSSLPPDPRGLPQGSPVSGVLANIFMTSFDKALINAGAEHIRYIDDITLVANSPEQLVEHLDLAMRLIRRLGLQLNAGKTEVAYLGPGTPQQGTLVVPGCSATLSVHREFDLLGVHFYGDGRFRARHRTVNKLLSRVWRIIDGKGDRRPLLVRYIAATATINRMLGYHVGVRRPGTRQKAKTSVAQTGVVPNAGTPVVPQAMTEPAKAGPVPPRRRLLKRVRKARLHSSADSARKIKFRRAIFVTGRVWIGGMRFVQPRQHALLGYSPLVATQMHRVDELIGRWMRQKFAKAIAAAYPFAGLLASLQSRRVRSAVKMYDMAVREPPPKCPGGPP